MAMAARVVSPSRESSKVSVSEVFVVRPSESMNHSTIFLSNIDRAHGYFSRNLLFFRDNPGTQAVVEHLHRALSKLLLTYPGHAGRLVVNPVTNRMEIDCNSAGSLLASATSHLSMHDVSVEDFHDFFLNPVEARSFEDLPLLTVQVTHLRRDNAFAIAILSHHMLDDASSWILFMLNLASISRGGDLYLAPNFDRTLLRARNPPRVEFEHREFTKVGTGYTNARFTGSPDSILAAQNSQFEAPRKKRTTYHFNFHRLNELKKLVTHDGLVSRCSSFEALAALVWRAHAMACNCSSSTPVKLRYVVDTRNILQPPLGSNFSGNGQFTTVAEMHLEDMSKLSSIVLCIQEARKKLTDEYIRSAIDYLELHPDHWYICDTTLINAWPRLMSKAVDLDLGWGKPARVEFPLDPRNSSIIFFPFDANGNIDGFYVSVGLDPAPLAVFEEHIAFTVLPSEGT